MNRSFFIVVLITAALVETTAPGGCASASSDQTVARIQASEVSSKIVGKHSSRTACIDVRNREEYLAGHIPGAVNIGLKEAAAGKAAALRRYSTIIICGSNPASASAMAMAKKLTAQGYPDVQLFAGGMDAWRRAGLPIQRGDRSAKSRRPKKD